MGVVHKMSALSFVDKKMLENLLKICKEHQGEVCYDVFARGTYSHEFIDATTEICRLLKRNEFSDPRLKLLSLFRAEGIRSCRTEYFSEQSITYLYNNFVRMKLR